MMMIAWGRNARPVGLRCMQFVLSALSIVNVFCYLAVCFIRAWYNGCILFLRLFDLVELNSVRLGGEGRWDTQIMN